MGLSSVTLGTTEQRGDFDALHLPVSFLEPHWYATYTCAQHEKRVAAELGMREVEHFLPLYSSVRRWRDRRVQHGNHAVKPLAEPASRTTSVPERWETCSDNWRAVCGARGDLETQKEQSAGSRVP